MKKLIMFLVVGIMMFSLAACGGEESNDDSGADSVAESNDNEYEQAKKDILAATDQAYSGLTAVDGSVYFLLSSDGKFAVLVLEGNDEKSYIRFIGSATKNENNVITVTDKDSGYTFSFTAEAQDEGYFLDCGNLGELYVSPSEPEVVLDSMIITFEEMTDKTKALVDEIAK